MKLDRLELENWMGIPQLQLEFGKGINLIYGRNEIGKSSVLESIRKALLGDSSSARPEYKSLKPWGAKIKAGVDLHFTAGKGKKYRLSKTFPKGKGELYKEGVLFIEDSKKTNSELFKILGIPEAGANLFQLLFIDQGESLEIFNPKQRDKLLDAGTRSYIKEVIKETAFKDIRELEDRLNREMDAYLTASRKKPSAKSDYARILNDEEEKGQRLDQLKEREASLVEKLREMEDADSDLKNLEKETGDKESFLSTLKKKKEEWDDLEKRETAFGPIAKDYETFKNRSMELEELGEKLPLLMAVKEHRLEELKTRLKELENEKESAVETLDQLKAKKKESETLQAREREFTALEKDYKEVKTLKARVTDLEKKLPLLLSRFHAALVDELGAVTKKHGNRTKQESELAAVDAHLKNIVPVTPEQLSQLKELEKEIAAINGKLQNISEEMRLSFRLESTGAPVPFTYTADSAPPVSGEANDPVEIEGFRQLDFQYPGHLNIRVAGHLAKTDVKELQQTVSRLGLQLKEKLAFFGADSVEAVEQRSRDYENQKRERELLLKGLEASEDAGTLEKQRQELIQRLDTVKKDMEIHVANDTASGVGDSDGANPGARELDDSLKTVKMEIETEQRDINRVLEARGCTVEALEELYEREKESAEKMREAYRIMPPLKVAVVDEEHLEQESNRCNQLDLDIMAVANDLGLLDAMDIPGEFPGPDDSGDGPRFNGEMQSNGMQFQERSSQKIRDDIRETVTREREVQEQLSAILGERTAEVFKTEYVNRKDELDVLREKIKKESPPEAGTREDVTALIEKTEMEIKVFSGKRLEIEKHRAQLIGETGDFVRLREEREDLEREYGLLLKDIRNEVAVIASLKLLARVVEEEKAKAQEEVFKPLQERVARSFSALVGDRYRVGIDNDLNIEISGRTGTGEYEKNVDTAMSFGTREQLSFLFRLGIASQLSRKEPVVMVLDDSFVNTDAGRLPVLLDMIREQAKDLQFLVFTCRPEDYLGYFGDKAKELTSINLEEMLV